MQKPFIKTLVVIVGFIAFPLTSLSQGIFVPESPQALTLKVSPAVPKPNSTVVVSADSSAYDLNRATMLWTLNGVEYQKGAGLKSVSFMSPANGETLVVGLSVATLEGIRLSRSVIVRPSNVDIIWEAYSSVPPFYKGKALISYETFVKIVAFPELLSSSGSMLNPNGLIYKWSKDGTVLGSESGLGKTSITVRMPQLSDIMTVSVEVSSADNLISGRTSVVLRANNPETNIYEDHPLFGIRFDNALKGDENLEGKEIVLVGYPYFFSPSRINDPRYKYSWRINRMTTNITTNKITLRAPEGQRGRSQISLKIDNLKEIMQSAESSLNVLFGSDTDNANPFF